MDLGRALKILQLDQDQKNDVSTILSASEGLQKRSMEEIFENSETDSEMEIDLGKGNHHSTNLQDQQVMQSSSNSSSSSSLAPGTDQSSREISAETAISLGLENHSEKEIDFLDEDDSAPFFPFLPPPEPPALDTQDPTVATESRSPTWNRADEDLNTSSSSEIQVDGFDSPESSETDGKLKSAETMEDQSSPRSGLFEIETNEHATSSRMEAGGEELYEVERIIDRRRARHSIEYYVKWKGYPIDEGTWETCRSLTRGAWAAVEAYERGKRLEMEREVKKRSHKKRS